MGPRWDRQFHPRRTFASQLIIEAMLHSITWQEFILAFAAVVTTYYAVTILILYKTEITGLFKRKTTYRGNALTKDSGTQMMGGIQKTETIGAGVPEQHINADALLIQAEGTDSLQERAGNSGDSDALILGTISDLLEEIKTVTQFIQENRSTKQEAITFLKTLLSRYGYLKETKYQSAINIYVLNELKSHEEFSLTNEEITGLWP